MYERFTVVVQTPEVKGSIENYLLEKMNSYIAQFSTILDNIENKFPERMDSIEDRVCSIYGTVRDSFIQNKTAMQNEFELDLSTEQQNKLRERRLKLGAQQFEIRKRLYVAKRKTPIHECFINAEDMQGRLDEAQAELDEKTESVASILNSSDFQARLKSVDTLKTSIGFNVMFLMATLMEASRPREGFEDVPSYADMQLPFSMTSVTDAQKSYVDSIRQAQIVIKTIQNIPQLNGSIDSDYTTQNNLWNAIERKKQELQNKSEPEQKEEIEKYKAKNDIK